MLTPKYASLNSDTIGLDNGFFSICHYYLNQGGLLIKWLNK